MMIQVNPTGKIFCSKFINSTLLSLSLLFSSICSLISKQDLVYLSYIESIPLEYLSVLFNYFSSG